MDQNGFNNNNFFEGPVFIEGDTDIDGNLTVSGTYPSGGGGSVDNPMTSNLDAGNFTIFNVNTLDTDIITSSNSTISFNSKGISNLTFIGSPNGGADIITLNGDIRSINGHFLDGITNITGYGSGDVLNLNGDIRITTGLNLLGNNITTINNTETKGISSSTSAVAFTSILNMFNDINMGFNDIFNVERLTASHASVSLNLDMIPATEGKAGQILARDPSYTPGNFSTHKLVWTNQSAGGGVTNPMTVALDGGGFNISNVNILTVADIYTPFLHKPVGNLSIISDPLSVNTFLRCNTINPLTNPTIAMPSVDFSGVIKTNTITPYSGSAITATSLISCSNGLNSDLIKPVTNLGIVIDSKAPDGITDSKITLSAPNIILNNSTNLAPSLVTITGDIQITNGNGYIHGNNLFVRGRNASAVPTPITIEGTTTSINSSTLNITSSTSNNFLGAINTNFSGTVRTNTIDANSGGNISILQNLTLATGRQLRTDLVFADGIRSYTTDLILAGLLPDNKTQTNILLASPQISLNNQFGTLTPETQVNIAGNIIFNNPITQPFINGANLTIRGRTPAGVPTVLGLEGSTISIIATTAININANAINIIKNVNLLSNRGSDINPSMVLYRSVGAPSTAFNITNGATFVNVTNGQTAKGSKSIPANSLVANDLYKFNVVGLMTSEAKIDMTFSIYSGANRLCTFTFNGDGLTNQGFEFTTTLCVTPVSLGVVSLSTGIGKFEKDGKQISYATPVNNINLTVAAINTFDVYIKPVSTMAVGSVTIYNYTLENI
jgi:hypothetical protein